MRKRFIPSLLLAVLVAEGAQAGAVADSLCATVRFRPSSATLELPYMDNAGNIGTLSEGIRGMEADPGVRIRRIRIVSSASPEGNSKVNKELALKRGEELREYLKGSLSLPDSLFTVRSEGEGWNELAEMVSETDAPWRDKALAIIRNTPEWVVRDGKVVDGRKRQLMNLDGGRAWFYMKDNLFGKMRGGALVVCETEREKQPTFPSPAADIPEETSAETEEKTVSEEPVPVEKELDAYEAYKEMVEKKAEAGRTPFFMAAKTNLLYDAALVPNIGLEFYLGKGWSIGGDWLYAWWSKDSRHRYWRLYGGELEVRKYFGGKAEEKPLQGHHLGVYAQGLTYDFETGGKGNLSDFSYGVGIEYGYSLPVAKRLNLDFGIGIGYSGGKYKTYVPEDGCYVYRKTSRRRWFGPTRAEISLVWLLGNGNVNNKKGGSK